MKVKICGLKYPENITDIALLEPDYMGFIFYRKSKRFIGMDLETSHLKKIPKSIHKTGVFVDESPSTIIDIAQRYDLQFIQLHGNETPQECELLKRAGYRIIKAFSIHESFDSNQLEAYELVVDYFLFDTQTSGYGGSGIPFNWQLLELYKLYTPFFLSGGLGMKNIEQLLAFHHPMLYGFDFNSMLENKPGLKNTEQTHLILDKIRNYEHIQSR